MSQVCKRCQEPIKTQCPHCQSVFDCTRHCQKFDYYVNHIFTCPPSKDIKAADHLISAVFKKQIPSDPETLYHYGFSNCDSLQQQAMLLKMYENLIIKLGVRRDELDAYCTKGKLLDLINDKIKGNQPDDAFLFDWIQDFPELLTNKFTDQETVDALHVGQGASEQQQQQQQKEEEQEQQEQVDITEFFYRMGLMDRLRTRRFLQRENEPKSVSSSFYQNPRIRVTYGYERQFSGYFLQLEDARLKFDQSTSLEMVRTISQAIDPSGNGILFLFHTSPYPDQAGTRMSLPTLIEFMKLYNVPERYIRQVRQGTA